MAQEDLGIRPELDMREAEEIDRLLREQEQIEEQKGLQDHPVKRFFWNRKLIFGIALGVVLVFGTYLAIRSIMEKPLLPIETLEEPAVPVEPLPSPPLQASISRTYPLDPFFVPLLRKNKEVGKFLQVTVHLVMSHQRLSKDIDKERLAIRRAIYSILSRKKLKDFENSSVKIKMKLKREIKAASNSFLLSGIDTITEIAFSEFIITSI